MCDYPELMIWIDEVDSWAMQSEQLKSLVEAGHYKPEPALVAQAMLRRRSLRALLGTEGSIKPADRNPGTPTARPRAA